MRSIVAFSIFLLAGCAATTSVVMLDPNQKYPATTAVEILTKTPERSHIEIAKLESRGLIGETEPAVLEDARTKAAEIGADAIIVTDISSIYQPPIIVHDPWPPYLPWYRDRWYGYRYWLYPPPFPLYPPYPFFPDTTTLPGGNVYTIRSIAIKYR